MIYVIELGLICHDFDLIVKNFSQKYLIFYKFHAKIVITFTGNVYT